MGHNLCPGRCVDVASMDTTSRTHVSMDITSRTHGCFHGCNIQDRRCAPWGQRAGHTLTPWISFLKKFTLPGKYLRRRKTLLSSVVIVGGDRRWIGGSDRWLVILGGGGERVVKATKGIMVYLHGSWGDFK